MKKLEKLKSKLNGENLMSEDQMSALTGMLGRAVSRSVCNDFTSSSSGSCDHQITSTKDFEDGSSSTSVTVNEMPCQ